jgi:hypothetical protein
VTSQLQPCPTPAHRPARRAIHLRLRALGTVLAMVALAVAAPVLTSTAQAATANDTATPTSLNFGSITVGDVSLPQTVTFTNTSGNLETITGIGFTSVGPGADDFIEDSPDNCGNLISGQSCQIPLDFTPGALGTRNATLQIDDASGILATAQLTGIGTEGYLEATSTGAVTTHGDAQNLGGTSTLPLTAPIVTMAATGDNGGYWLVASDGGIFTEGDAQFFGSTGNLHLNKPIVGMAATLDDGGYWLVAADGGIFTFGDAPFFGSTGNLHLNQPIVGMAATPDDGGYWLVAADGGIFSFGDAPFFGSTGNLHLNKPIVGMAATPDGGGYWMVASDGGIFTFGDATFFGSAGNIHLNRPIVGMAVTPDGGGYWLMASDGGIFNYGDAPFDGSSANVPGNYVAFAGDGPPTLQAILDVPACRGCSVPRHTEAR